MVSLMNFRKVLVFGATLLLSLGSTVAVAAEQAEAVAGGGGIGTKFAAALALGIAAFGGALGQGKTAAAALEGIGRNPAAAGKLFVPMIIGLALIESLVIYALIINFL
jgi:F-type H+-transporting ATPase subunit c